MADTTPDVLDVPIPGSSDPAAVPAAEPAPSDTLPEAPKTERKTRTRAPRAPRTSTPRASGTRAKRLDIAGNMSQLYAAVGIGLSMVPGPQAVGAPAGVSVPAVTGMAITNNAEACGQAWAKAADENPAVREALEKLLTASVWGAVISAHVPIILAAAAAAGAVPPMVAQLFAGGDAS